MNDDRWVILGGPKASPTPKLKPTEAEKAIDYNITVTTAVVDVVDAVTSKPSVEVTIESPVLPVHGNGLSTNSLHASSNGTYDGEKIHHFGNSTGIMSLGHLSVMVRPLWSVRYGPSVRPKRRFLLLLLSLFLFLFLFFFSCFILFISVMLFM